jgi:hypothetical protein
MSSPLIKPVPTDVTFERYREPGDPGCLCSRCLLPIGAKAHPIIMVLPRGYYRGIHLRYHPTCLGFTSDGGGDDWGDNYEKLPY